MRCPRCQQENPAHARFCLGCGARLALACGSCGTELPGGARFCLQCGQPVATDTAAPSRSPSPETYTPKHLAEKILTSKAALEGERKQVTVLFADLKGSMELLADRDPEEARKLLDPVVEHMMEAVHRYEGTVNQVMGDGIMALFGAPLAHEDHAVRACYAALRMQESVKRYAEEVFRRHGVPVEIRVGLNSGEVVVRAIGSDLHMEYTAVGQTTHLAARMEQMARPGTILLAPVTLALAEGFVQVSSRGPVPVKGLSAPIEIFELAGASPVRSRLHAAASRGLTRFVGRDAEIEFLRQALGRAGEGHGQIVAVVGEPGVGKSRLVWEFTHSHRSQGWLVLETASVSYGRATTYFPVIELLRSYFGIEPRDDDRKMREKVTGKLLSLDRALEPTLPVFLSLLDVPVEGAKWTKLDPSQRRRQTLDALKRLLLRESQVQPVLLVVEDLHWIDSETQAWLDLLVESLPTARLLLLVNYRPEYGHGWGSRTYYQQVRLDALPMASAEELLEALLGTGPGLEDLRRLLIDRTEGNPFFLEESVRALVETRALTGERGAYRLAGPVRSLQLPATAQAILAARIDRLAPGDKRLLQAAAVVGKDVPFPLLEAIADEPEERLREGLERLQAMELLYEARLFPELEYTFKHALTYEAAYSGLLQDRRRALHARIVDTIETLLRERLDEHVDRLAHHAVRGELWERGFRYLVQAGRKAAGRLALTEAAAYLEQAVDTAERLPRTREVLEWSIDLRAELRGVLFNLGQFDRVRDHLTQANVLATEIGDDVRLGKITALEAHYHCIMVGDMPRAAECAQRAVKIAEATRTPGLIGLARDNLGRVQHGRGDYLEAIATLSANIKFLQGDLADERYTLAMPLLLGSRVWLAFSLAEVGRFREAMSVAAEAKQQAESLGHPYSLFHAYWAEAAVYFTQGEHERGAGAAHRSWQVAMDSDAERLADNQRGLMAYGRRLAGHAHEAIELLEDALAPSKRRNSFTGDRDVLCLADAYLAAGRFDEALRTVQRSLDMARTKHQCGREAQALRILGEAYLALDDQRRAEEAHRDALALSTAKGMRPLVAHCHLGLGSLYRRTDKRQEAREHLTIATTMYREMDMPFWLKEGRELE